MVSAWAWSLGGWWTSERPGGRAFGCSGGGHVMWAVLALRPDPEPLEPVFLSLLCGVHSALGKLTLSSPSLGHPPPPGARQRRPPTRHHCPEARRPPHAGFGSQSCASVGRRCDSDALQSVWPRERAAGQRGQRSGHSPPPSPQRGLYSAPAGDRQQLPGLLLSVRTVPRTVTARGSGPLELLGSG